ncbi:MAG: LysE family transporter [Chlamydiales bacterium]|nr:LysE family transporter [Chlamydiales bacterium]
MIALIALVGAASPGPDFVVVTKNSLAYGRRAGLYTALGVGLGVFVHVAYCLAGIGLMIAESVTLFNVIKYSGAAYLIYIGVKSVLAKPRLDNVDLNGAKIKAYMPSKTALKTGFLTNALNPKATIFFLSVFSQVIDPSTPLFIQLLFGVEIGIIVLAWFCLLAYLLSHDSFRARLARVQQHLEKSMGVLLVLFGLKIAMI